MTNFTAEGMNALVRDTLDHASAPVGSTKYRRTPEVMQPIAVLGDDGDRWVFTSTLATTVVKHLGLDAIPCPCGDPDHKASAQIGFVAIDPNDPEGKPEVFYADSAPEELIKAHPEYVAFARMVNADISDDDEASIEIWSEAVRGGYSLSLVSFAAKQAGDIRRMAAGQAGAN